MASVINWNKKTIMKSLIAIILSLQSHDTLPVSILTAAESVLTIPHKAFKQNKNHRIVAYYGNKRLSNSEIARFNDTTRAINSGLLNWVIGYKIKNEYYDRHFNKLNVSFKIWRVIER